MKIGIIASPVPGHLNPLCTFGRALKKRGHTVYVFGILDTQKKIEAEGLNFLPFGQEDFPANSWEDHWVPMAQKAGLAVLVMTAKLHTLIARLMCRDIPTHIKSLGIDALVIDQLQFQGRAIAEFCSLPFVSVSCTLVLNRDLDGLAPPPFVPWGYAKGNIFLRLGNAIAWLFASLLSSFIIREGNRLLKRRCIFSMEDSFSTRLQIVPMPKSLDFPARFRHNCVHYAGCFVDQDRPQVSFPFERLRPGKPLIYASCGTLQNHRLDIYETIARACESLDCDLVLALGDWRLSREMPMLPGNPIVVGYAPQLDLLRRAALCITHAGPNTVYESLSYGVPMVAVPIANDQPAVGARLAVSGAAEVIALADLNVADLRQAIEKVLFQAKYRERAKQFASEIAAAGGVDHAAMLAETALMEKPAFNRRSRPTCLRPNS